MYTIKVLTLTGNLIAKLQGRTAHQLIGSVKDNKQVKVIDEPLDVIKKIFKLKEGESILKVTENFKIKVGELNLFIDKGYYIKEV